MVKTDAQHAEEIARAVVEAINAGPKIEVRMSDGEVTRSRRRMLEETLHTLERRHTDALREAEHRRRMLDHAELEVRHYQRRLEELRAELSTLGSDT